MPMLLSLESSTAYGGQRKGIIFFWTESFKITKVIIRIHKPSLKNVGSSAVGKTFMQKRRRWNIEIAPHLWPSEIKW